LPTGDVERLRTRYDTILTKAEAEAGNPPRSRRPGTRGQVKQSPAVTIQLLKLGHWGLPLERQDERVEKIVGLFAAGRKAEADDGQRHLRQFRSGNNRRLSA